MKFIGPFHFTKERYSKPCRVVRVLPDTCAHPVACRLLPRLPEEFRNGAELFSEKGRMDAGYLKRRIIMTKWKCLVCYCISAFFVFLGFAVFNMASDAYAGGVYFGVGIDGPPPGYAVAPPEVVYPPGVVVERAPPPPRVVVERPRPVIVYEEPFVVERRSSVYYYYRPSYQYHSYRVETESEYHKYRNDNWEDDSGY